MLYVKPVRGRVTDAEDDDINEVLRKVACYVL